MKVLDVKQGGPDWHLARLGIPTASQFHRIVTAKGRSSDGAETYMHELLAEWLIGVPSGAAQKEHGLLERGRRMESWAIGLYELRKDVSVRRVGLILSDDGLSACSPDALVGDDGGLEIKVPGAAGHVANMLDMTERHFTQVQGNLWLTNRLWWDLVSYNDIIPPAIVRIERDAKYIEALAASVPMFVSNLLVARQKLLKLGCTPADALDPDFVASLAA